MPLSPRQRARLAELAQEEGVDPDELIAEAEASLAEKKPAPTGVEPSSAKPPKPSTPEPAATPAAPEQPKLFMYHLPFVTVNEVRTKWLGLDPMDGGEENAAAFAARMQGTTPKPEGT